MKAAITLRLIASQRSCILDGLQFSKRILGPRHSTIILEGLLTADPLIVVRLRFHPTGSLQSLSRVGTSVAIQVRWYGGSCTKGRVENISQL